MHLIVRLVVQLLGIAHEHLRIQGAIQVYEACRHSRMMPLLYFCLGTLLGRQGQWLQARSCLERAAQLKPDYAEVIILRLGFTEYQDKMVTSKTFKEMWSHLSY